MKKQNLYLAALLVCLPCIGNSQTFIEDLDRISQSNEIAKQCDALAKSGGMDDRCRAVLVEQLARPIAVMNNTTRTINTRDGQNGRRPLTNLGLAIGSTAEAQARRRQRRARGSERLPTGVNDSPSELRVERVDDSALHFNHRLTAAAP